MGHKITVLKTGLKSELITPKKHSYWIWFFITVGIEYTNLAPFWPNVDFMTSQVLWNFQMFEKWGKIKFPLQKIYMVPSLKLSIVILLWFIALELLWRIWESDVNKEAQFHTFFQTFYKNFKILLLSYNLSHLVPTFKKIVEKLAHLPRCMGCFISM